MADLDRSRPYGSVEEILVFSSVRKSVAGMVAAGLRLGQNNGPCQVQ